MPNVKALSMVFTRFRNSGLKHLTKCLKFKGWKGLKIDDPTLYYLNISYNFFNWENLKQFFNIFTEKIPPEYALKNNVPLECGLRVLILTQNFIASRGAEIIGKALPK